MKYKRSESSRKDLLRMVGRLAKHNIALLRELHAWREFKKAVQAK